MKILELHTVKAILLLGILIISCREDVDLDLPERESKIVVEGFINDRFPDMNYVILSRSQSFGGERPERLFIDDAEVRITPGIREGEDYIWDESESVLLSPVSVDTIAFTVYLDMDRALEITPGKHYLLEVKTDDEEVSAVTSIPQPVDFMLDYSIGSRDQAIVEFIFQDPGNSRNYYYHGFKRGDRMPLLWGDLSGTFVFSDEQFQGSEGRFGVQAFLEKGDTVQVFLNGMDRQSFDYLQSRSRASGAGSPFSSPVQIISNVENGYGGFVGFSVSYEKIIIE